MQHLSRVPNHLAVIMDGNRRWAKQQHLPIEYGHNQGAKVAKKFVDQCFALGIKYVTLFTFSSENWQRSASEIKTLTNLLKRYLREDFEELIARDIKLSFIGEISRFDQETQDLIANLTKRSVNNCSHRLTLALSYGGRNDITNAVKKLLTEVEAGTRQAKDITEEEVAQHLMTADMPEPDLFIRTSGENRLSNFLIWQLAYTELLFINKYWPAFDESDLIAAINEYNRRERRYGV